MVGSHQTPKLVGPFPPDGDRIRAVEIRDVTCLLPQMRHLKIIEFRGAVAHRGG